MIYYLKNLLIAFFGINPFQLELEQVKEDYKKTETRVARLDECYESLKKKMLSTHKKIGDYQRIIENLRQRIAEKDELLNRMKDEYQQRINKYNTKIDELQGKLASKGKK